MSILTLAVLWIFFVAGADAGTIVLGSLSTGGPPEPKRWIKLAWGLAMALIAGILLLAGGLGALQSASVLTGLPFAFIMVLMCYSFYKHLRDEARETARRERGESDLTIHRRTGTPPAGSQAFTAEKAPNPGRLTNPGDRRGEGR
jgi:glycine betaine transporter